MLNISRCYIANDAPGIIGKCHSTQGGFEGVGEGS